MWPSSEHWAQVAEDYEIPYNGSTITYQQATGMQIGGNATDVSEMIEEFIQGNFMKVMNTLRSLINVASQINVVLYDFPKINKHSLLNKRSPPKI